MLFTGLRCFCVGGVGSGLGVGAAVVVVVSCLSLESAEEFFEGVGVFGFGEVEVLGIAAEETDVIGAIDFGVVRQEGGGESYGGVMLGPVGDEAASDAVEVDEEDAPGAGELGGILDEQVGGFAVAVA